MNAKDRAQAIVSEFERSGYTLSTAQRMTLLRVVQCGVEAAMTDANPSRVEIVNQAYEEAATHLERCERSSLFARRAGLVGTLRAAIEEIRGRKLG